MRLFTKAFWLRATETAVVTGAAAFAGSGVFSAGQPTLHGLVAALVAAGVAALYAFVKQVGSVQTARAAAAKSNQAA
jgi:hypothetical protein